MVFYPYSPLHNPTFAECLDKGVPILATTKPNALQCRPRTVSITTRNESHEEYVVRPTCTIRARLSLPT